MESILDHLRHWELCQPNARLFAFLDATGKEQQSYTYHSFSDRTRRVARALRNELGLKHGDRAILAYPPGLESLVAFFACLRLGVIPAPAYAPPLNGAKAGVTKLDLLARDCQATAVLSTTAYGGGDPSEPGPRAKLDRRSGRSTGLRRFATDEVPPDAPLLDEDRPHPVMFLQYTSGSTDDPKGVTVTHANVVHNCQAAFDHRPIGVCWLPQYHDMGLIGHYLFIVVAGGSNYGFSSFDFLRRPVLWLETISHVQATATAAPNFAYEYCLREDKIPDESLRDVDLGSLRLMLNAAEPVRATTLRRFGDRFAPYGLRREAFVAGYGLAENTVAVSMGGRQILKVNKLGLQRRHLQIEKTTATNNNQIELVSCGRPLAEIQARIVDPESRAVLGEDQIGEIWVAGDSKCSGYWGRPDINRQMFEAEIAGEPGSGSYLRTGDLGFLHEGELYVCGRVKDLIIIRGVNYYPQDIEAIVEAHLHDSGGAASVSAAAFSVSDDGEERLVVLIETRKRQAPPDPAAVSDIIRASYFIEPHTVAFVPPRSIARTTSGKIARSQTRDRWIQGDFPTLRQWVKKDPAADRSGGLEGLLRRIRQVYDLDGREHRTVAEIGMDSLTTVELVLEIQKYFDDRGMSGSIDMVDAGFVQDQPISRLFSLVETCDGGDEGRVEQTIEALHAEHVAGESSQMRSDADYRFGAAASLPAAQTFDRVLLTGPTGFFGPFLLANLLDQTPATVDVLVRAADVAHGQRRIAAALRRAGLWTRERDDQMQNRLRVFCGDLSQEWLGLEHGAWRRLAEESQAILHNGAVVNYLHSYQAMRSQNVCGTRELLRLATSVVQKPFHFISSTFIFGWSTKPVLWESESNNDMAGLDFGYSQTKWVAEELVRRAASQGLPARIYRPSLISPSSSGAGSRDDIAIRLLAFMIKYELAVASLNQVSLLRADVAAGNIVSIFLNGAATGGALHVTADKYFSFADVTREITELYGYPFRYCAIPEFIDEMNRLCTQEDGLYPLRPFLTRAHRKIEAMEHKRYDNRDYRQARNGGRQEPCLAETVSAIVEFMLKEGLIPSPPRADARARRGSYAASAGMARFP